MQNSPGILETSMGRCPVLGCVYIRAGFAFRRGKEDGVTLMFMVRAGYDLRKAMACWEIQAEFAKKEVE